jgi:dihydropteroate synthase
MNSFRCGEGIGFVSRASAHGDPERDARLVLRMGGDTINGGSSALRRAEEMVEEGAAIIDVGGESTRPGADPVPLDVELKRVLPVIQTSGVPFPSVPLSVDTTKAEVARQALEEGASHGQ